MNYKPEPIDSAEYEVEYGKGGYARESRPSPSDSATLFDENYIKRGNDGNLWKIIVASNGVQRWSKLTENEQNMYEDGDYYGSSEKERGKSPTFAQKSPEMEEEIIIPVPKMSDDDIERLPFYKKLDIIFRKSWFHYHIGDTVSSAIGEPFFFRGRKQMENDGNTLIIVLQPKKQLNSPDSKYVYVKVGLTSLDLIDVTIAYHELIGGKLKKMDLLKLDNLGLEDMPKLDGIIQGHKLQMKENFEKAKQMETTDTLIAESSAPEIEAIGITPLPKTIDEIMKDIPVSPLEYNLNCRNIIDFYRRGNPNFPYADSSHTKVANVPVDVKERLSGYTGMGGKDFKPTAQEARTILHEYYTPSEIILKMWGLAHKHGYNGGAVLEPAVATGRFFKYAPENTRLVGIELNYYSYAICVLIYGDKAKIHNQAFEQLFIRNNQSVKNKLHEVPKYDLVIGNPPYGNFEGFYAGMGEKAYTRARSQVEYFLFRGLDCLNTGGVLVYIIGTEIAFGGVPFLDQQPSPVKEAIAEKGELIDAYRLPNGIFEGTDVLTDIVVFKKK